jgi:hypothetical protein
MREIGPVPGGAPAITYPSRTAARTVPNRPEHRRGRAGLRPEWRHTALHGPCMKSPYGGPCALSGAILDSQRSVEIGMNRP